jgi:DEAD/DEAH box helicase domain-containing protein
LETQKLAQEVGGWNNKDKMLLSLGVVYHIEQEKYTTYFEKDADTLIKELQSANLVVGFNIKNFDYAVLQRYSIFDLQMIPTLDMLETVNKAVGFRLKLDQLAKGTLGDCKSADGVEAVKFFREGRWKELEYYCQKDVEITYKVYDYGRKNGCLFYEDSLKNRRKIEVKWN